VDQLETDLFFAACARRASRDGAPLRGDEVLPALSLEVLDGAVPPLISPYHSHGFDWTVPEEANAIVGGDLMPRPRSTVRVWLSTQR
jgi:hypothetical protein